MTALLVLARLDVAGLAGVLCVGAAVAWLAGVIACRRTLRRPARRTYASAVARGQPGVPTELDESRWGVGSRLFESWGLQLPGGIELPVWEVEGLNPAGPTVVMTHGWGDSRVGALLRLEPFVRHASRVLMWDMPGHGEAPPGAGPCGLGRTEPEALVRLVERTHGPVVLFGWSLGGGVGLVAASRCSRVVGVVCEAPYRLPGTPARRVMAAMGMPGLGLVGTALWTIGGTAWQRIGGPFDRAVFAAALGVPTLVVHGSDDPVCPAEDGAQISAAAERGSLELIPGGRHNDLWINPQLRRRVVEAVDRWMETLHGARPTS